MRSWDGTRGLALTMLAAQTIAAAAGIAPPNVTVGEGLEVAANVTIGEAAPAGGLELTVTSGDPGQVLFSKTAEDAGAAEIRLTVRAGLTGSPDFYVQGLGNRGTVNYTVSAPGYSKGTGTVTLAPSGVVFLKSGTGVSNFFTTTGAGKSDLPVYTVLLDAERNYTHPQPVAGGRRVSVTVTSSDAKVAEAEPATVTIAGGSASASVGIRPMGAGQAVLSLSVPQGFSAPAQFARVPALVIQPGMAVTDEISIGKNLQAHGVLNLGEPAPAAGVTVTLTSSDARKLLLSHTADQVGTDCITIAIPGGGVKGSYYLQALEGAGLVTYTATAPGFRERTGTVALTPSGIVIGGPQGPPDEAELLNKEIAEGPHGFVTSLAAGGSTVVTAYAVQLDPRTLRGADLTVQAVRPGVTIRASLTNSNPAAGSVRAAELTIPAGSSSAATQFTPASVGTTVIAVTTPAGYTKAGNSTALTVMVRE